MYITYFTYRSGRGACGVFEERPHVNCMKYASECTWIVPGTVDPRDD